MDMLSKILLIAVLATLCVKNTNARRKKWKHVLYWDPHFTPKLKSNDFTYNVEIGQFMDILCPQTKLRPEKSEPLVFDIFNVTQDGYRSCDNSAGKLIFSCNMPERENKLTIKFQEISPSPYGFRFQYCEEYYFIASPRSHESGRKGCHKEAMRMKLKVGCKATTTASTTTEKPKTTTTTEKTTTSKPIQSYFDKVKADATEKKQEKDEQIIPNLVTVTDTTKTVKGRYISPSNSKQVADNSANKSFSTSIILLLVTLSIFLQRFVSP